ncbi:LANO_0H07316g1_1 [Lachancea nothofagi CBS 11611]|uniref:LANO_0H07316g1_1 n=1 Tax=Lachancea nothofagi CBS 11611 TaxID=1266666 RepID=A0A1G4KLS4_9SACH|nr:LANO_0H07316g1_1 [Lachancea nothofagi CBS 11611]
MSTEDDKRITVETETVQTPAQNLLPVQPEDQAEDDSMSEIAQGEASAKLIDHNPLSLHNCSGAIRNKKSSLFMDSFLGKEPSPSVASGVTHTGGASKPLVTSNPASKPFKESLEESALPSRPPPVEDHKSEEKTGSSAALVPTSGEHTNEDSTRKTRELPKKSDFFAARLASAVGENEISDSEETFVYESTGNSNSNAVPGEQRSHGLAGKMSAPLLNQSSPSVANAKLLNRAKATRHTSIAAIPPPLSEQSDDLHSLRFVNRNNPQEIRSVRSYTTMPQSPGKRLSLISLAQNGGTSAPRRTSRKISSNSNVNNARRKASQKRQLRTTASKIFDAHGASLRRYSGIPDDVNLEDYIEQTGGELTPKKFAYHSDSEYEDDNISYAHHGDDEEDTHSMFYYSHPKVDLEARNGLSDYDEEEEHEEDDRAGPLGYQPGIDYYGDNYFYQPTEATPLNKKTSHYTGYSPHNFYTTKTTWTKLRNFVYFAFVVSFLLTLGFISGFLLATNKELHDLEISKITSVLVSTDELVFDVIATAFNPGFFTVEIHTVELDIFAKTSHLISEGDPSATPYQTILLGTVENMETSLQFQGGFFSRNYDLSRSSVKLLRPGNVDDRDKQWDQVSKIENGLDKWRQLIRYDFELIVRGNMYYRMPFFNSEKSIGVQCSTTVKLDAGPI